LRHWTCSSAFKGSGNSIFSRSNHPKKYRASASGEEAMR
jgi:hypothetical protein